MRVYSLLLALILTVGVSSASAQTGASFGVKAGVNFANLDFSGDDAEDLSFDRRVGLVAGAFMLFPVSETFGFQVEGLFSQKGAKFNEDDFEDSVELDYFDVPVLARYTVPSTTGTSFHLFAGPSFGFKLSAKSKSSFDGEDDEETDISDDTAGLDLGLVVGAGIDFGKFIVDGRYTHGLTNLNKVDNESLEIKSRVFSIMAGFRF